MPVLGRIAAVLLGVVAFLAGALVLQLARGLEDGALVDPTGNVISTVPPGGVWVAGAAVMVVAFVAALFARGDRISWFSFGATIIVLLVAGSIPSVPAWLAAGAASPVTWTVAGIAIALGVRAQRSGAADQ